MGVGLLGQYKKKFEEKKQLMNQDEDVHRLDEMFFIRYHYRRGTLFQRGPLGCFYLVYKSTKMANKLVNTIKHA